MLRRKDWAAGMAGGEWRKHPPHLRDKCLFPGLGGISRAVGWVTLWIAFAWGKERHRAASPAPSSELQAERSSRRGSAR